MNQKNEWWRLPEFQSFFQQSEPNKQNGLGAGGQFASMAPTIGKNRSNAGYTGKGPDGIGQPNRRVPGAGNGKYDAHEQEFIFDANSTQAIGPDILNATMQKAQSGDLDINALRTVVGLPPKKGYQIGGLTSLGSKPNIGNKIKPLTNQKDPIQKPPINNDLGVINPITPNISPIDIQNPIIPNINPIQINPNPTPTPNNLIGPHIGNNTNPFVNPHTSNIFDTSNLNVPNKIPNVINPINPNITPIDIQNNNTNQNLDWLKQHVQNSNGTGSINSKDWLKKWQDNQNGIHTPIIDPNISINPNVITPNDVINPNQIPNINPIIPNINPINPIDPIDPIIPDITPIDIPNIIDPNIIQDLEQNGINQQHIIDYINGIMDGNNPLFATLKNALGQDLAGAGAAATAAMKQEAAMAGMNPDQVATIGMSRQRENESNIAKALTDLTSQEQQTAMNAAGQLWNMTQDIQAQGNWEQQTDIAKQQWQKTFDFAQKQYGDQEGGRIAMDIASGMTYESIKKKYGNKVTLEDYNSMKEAGPIGQQQWQKEVWQKQFDFEQDQWNTENQQNAFNMLMQSGDFKNAAKMFSDIYGTSIDFSHLQDEATANKFNEGWNNMNGLIASGTSWDNALKIMQKDGTLEKLGMTEGDVKQFYEESQLMADPLYKAMKMTDTWVKQGLMTQDEADDFTAFLKWSMTNTQGVTIEDGFAVKDKNGNEVGFFKNQADADKFVKDNPNSGYTSNAVTNHVSQGTNTNNGSNSGTEQVPDWADETLYKPLKEKFGKDLTEDQYNTFDENYDETMAMLNNKYTDLTPSNINGLKTVYDNMPDSFKKDNDFYNILNKVSPDQASMYKQIKDNDVTALSNEDYDKLFNTTAVHWETKNGKKRWMMNDNLKQFVEQNKGKYININGKMWNLDSYQDGDPDVSKSYPIITLNDPKTGTKIKIAISGQGKQLFNTQAMSDAIDGVTWTDSGVHNLYDTKWPDSSLTDVEHFS